ncbi:putative transcriptional regulator [Salinibacillus kushneri]|uniref:Putative transcriptional regulator n=1 Tax=Salinibacillus kushneri TaxID=237682 RepID=A0A1I0B1N1_9BACI|nr:helix-turn-helix transcriptional regulator [Salinibacillus kushneri]SET00558.1 putative transcriptional regulator [Salinibacillus kushneri]
MKKEKRWILIELRKNMSMSQKDVVTTLREDFGIKITDSYYGMIEQGVRNPSLKLALSIAKIFNSNPEEIFFKQKYNKTLCGREVI